jgi:L-iditol 2-dehydrogenase
VKSFNRSAIKEGDTVLVIGLGVMGMMHILLASHFGAGTVIGADLVDFRLKKALELGADAVINVSNESLQETTFTQTNGKGADIVIVGPNSVKAMDSGIKCTAPGGTAVLFTPAKPGEKFTFDPNYIYFRDINIVTSYSCGPDDTRKSLAFIQRGIVTAQKLVTHRFPIEETGLAYQMVAQAWESLKVLITFE